METQPNSLKSILILIGSLVIFIVFTVSGVQTNGMSWMWIFIFILCALVVLACINNPKRIPWAIAIIVVLVLGSGITEFFNLWEIPFKVEVDNSTKLYPMPEDPNLTQQETLDWIDGKWVIHAGEGAQKVFLYSWVSSVVTFFLFLFIAWLLARSFMPAKIRGGSIPIQFIMAVVFAIVGFSVIANPLNTDGMSQKAIQYIDIQWFAGFLQNRWWLMLLTGIVTVTNWLRGQSARWPITATIMSATTWLLMPLLQTAFNPTMISWTACSQMVFDSELSNALCQEAFASGATTMLILSMAWGLIVSMIAELLGFSSGDED